MNIVERFQFIFLVAGIGFFVLAFFVSGMVTVNAVSDLPYSSGDNVIAICTSDHLKDLQHLVLA